MYLTYINISVFKNAQMCEHDVNIIVFKNKNLYVYINTYTCIYIYK